MRMVDWIDKAGLWWDHAEEWHWPRWHWEGTGSKVKVVARPNIIKKRSCPRRVLPVICR